MATKTRSKEPDNVHTMSDGIKIRIKPVDIIFVQSTIKSVKMPKKPTYTQLVGFNQRPVEAEIDSEETAAQLEEEFPGSKKRWEQYEEDASDASSERTDRSLKAIFLSGTEAPKDDKWASEKWINKMDFIGIEIPEDREQAWVTFLLTNYEGDEILKLSHKIMQLTGVPEELLAAAEDTFQSSLQDDSGTE